MKVLALDVATNTGVAVGESCGNPTSLTVNLGKPPNGRRFSNALRMTQDLIAEHKPDLIVAEAAIGGPKASAYLIGLVACIEGCAVNRQTDFKTVNLGQIRKSFLGKHLTKKHFPALSAAAAKKAIKMQVVQGCALRGWPVHNDDEADALALWDYACATYAPGYQSKPHGGLF